MKRIEYIDSMRGLAMFMVIIYHISYGCFHSENLITKVVNVQLQLPLFFFISGFFADKMSGKNLGKTIVDKFSYLVVPAMIVMALYCWVMDFDFIEGLQKRLKEGYWFTLVLFEFIMIYLLTDYLSRVLKLSSFWKKSLHLIVGVILIYIASFSEKYNAKFPIINTFTIGEFGHYIYFVLGAILFTARELVAKSLSYKYLWGGVICLYIVADVFRYKYGFAMFQLGAMVSVTILTFLGLMMIWGAFICYGELSNSNICSRFLQLVGRRSLDVYFIHYFILPINMNFVGNFFHGLNIPIIEYGLAIVISLIVILFSLGIGYIVRLSPITAKWLLGVKLE